MHNENQIFCENPQPLRFNRCLHCGKVLYAPNAPECNTLPHEHFILSNFSDSKNNFNQNAKLEKLLKNLIFIFLASICFMIAGFILLISGTIILDF